MYNNQKRVELVKKRIYERNCQQQRHGIYGLSAVCMVLFTFLAGTLHVVAGHTQMAAQAYGQLYVTSPLLALLRSILSKKAQNLFLKMYFSILFGF